jgi:hypothetical protein
MEIHLDHQKLHKNEQRRRTEHFEVQRIKNFKFRFNDGLGLYFSVCHFVNDSGDFEGYDFFHFAGDEHRGDSQKVDFFGVINFSGLGEEAVHNIQRNKKSVGRTVK